MAARRQLQRMVEQGQVSREVTAQLVEEYDAREQELRLKVHLLQTINQDLLAQEQLTARRQLLQVEKNTLRALLTRGAISTAVQRELISELDRQLQEISEPQFEADGTSTGETNEVEVEQRRRTELDDALR
jgi:hypothetical protein